MVKKASLALVLSLSALLAFADDNQGGLINGDTWAILVSAPAGWVWDNATLRMHGIWGLFYKEGMKYSPTKLHIYISPTAKNRDRPSSLADFMRSDAAGFMSFAPDLRVKELAPYAPGMEYSFAMKDLDDSGNGYYQALAYYEGEDAFFVFVLSCRSIEERDRERSALLELLDSFTYIRKER